MQSAESRRKFEGRVLTSSNRGSANKTRMHSNTVSREDLQYSMPMISSVLFLELYQDLISSVEILRINLDMYKYPQIFLLGIKILCTVPLAQRVSKNFWPY
jgi:hypothetical protein